MRDAFLAGLSAIAVALGGCTMEHASSIGDPAAGLQSPADVDNNMWYGLYDGAYPDSSGSSSAHAQPSSGIVPQSPADRANEFD